MISLLLINYRSAALAAGAIRTARASCSSSLQAVVVDNSCDVREAEALRSIADVLIVAEANRGYAGGINLGRRACDGEILIACNPDVTFSADCIDRLAHALRDASVAGPALFWDEAHLWKLPPAERYTAWQRVDVVLAGRSSTWRAERDRRRFLRRARFWSLQQTTHVSSLSGAVLAIRASDFDDVEGFDERFPLYFEETDFLRRMASARKRIVHVPEARCWHLHNQSAVQVGEEASAQYAQSELRYLEKWNGPFVARSIKRFERPLPAHDAQRVRGPIAIEADDVIVEATPLPSFETAAGRIARRGELVDVPPNAWTTPVIYLRTVELRTGRVRATYARYGS